MYNQHFGLERAPFRITPDTKLFYPGGSRGEILEALIYAVTSGEGIVKVVGEVGSGTSSPAQGHKGKKGEAHTEIEHRSCQPC